MIKGLLRVVAYIVVCVLLQVTVFNHIHLFNLMTPFLYLYAIVKIPAGFTRVQVIWMAFITGLLVDIFSGTLGIHAAASTLIGYYRNPLMHAFTDKEMLEDASPSYVTLGTGAFMKYIVCLTFLHHTALYAIESLSLFDPPYLLLRIASSTVLTTLCLFVIEAFHMERRSGEL